MLAPENETQAADIIRQAAANGEALAICGGATRSNAASVTPDATRLTTRGLCGIVDYEPAEMVMTVKAGTPMREVEALLAANNQMMAFEPPDYRRVMGTHGEPTIGGVFATNASGPRRYVAGAARDGLLGIRFVNGQGQVLRAGGRVMKNVTGLDLVKLLAGSHGTLGLLTEVTFKVLPVPPSSTTVIVHGLDDEAAARAMAAAMAMPVDVSGAAHMPRDLCRRLVSEKLPDEQVTALRLEGSPASIAARAGKLGAVMSAFGAVSVLDMEDSKTLWQDIRDIHAFADEMARPIWRVSVAPSAGCRLVAGLRAETGMDAFYDWQGGLVWMRLRAEPDAERLRRQIRALGGGHATLVRVADGPDGSTATFQPQPDAVSALSARIKRKLDPADIFSPGKMGASI